MESGIEIDISTVKSSIEALSKRYEISAKFLMKDQMRLWMSDMIRVTPPKSAKIGRNAIAKGLSQIASGHMDNKILAIYTRAFQNSVDVKFGTYQDLEQLHEDSRVKGRIKKSYTSKETVGGLSLDAPKLYIKRVEYNKFLREKQKHVGRLKSGWKASADKFAGKYPSWITKSGLSEGSAEDRMGEEGSGYLMGTNSVPYADAYDWAYKTTLKKREADMGNNLEKRMDQLHKKFESEGQ